jgi:predicted secreted protein
MGLREVNSKHFNTHTCTLTAVHGGRSSSISTGQRSLSVTSGRMKVRLNRVGAALKNETFNPCSPVLNYSSHDDNDSEDNCSCGFIGDVISVVRTGHKRAIANG